jgi:DNA helicase HerA-like ATPase
MTNQLAPLDAGELTLWITRLTQTVDRGLREPARSAAAAALRDGLDGHDKLSLAVLIQLAFLSDGLRVAHLAIDADRRIERHELVRVTDLVRVAASKYCFALPLYESFGESFGDAFGDPSTSAATTEDIARFLRVHREDTGPFGQGRSEAWIGLALARRVEQATRNPGPLQDHERMLVRIMEAVFAGRATPVEQLARRRLRDLFEQASDAPSGVDPRAIAFCRSDGPEVFSTISHGALFHERDPFDVETIHAEARRVFYQQLERATTPETARRGQGRLMLVLGDSGAGKTHLLRALRAQVHGRRLGYVGYLQLSAEVDDSLEQPYDTPSLGESSLMYLSDGLVESRDTISPDDLERLRTAELSPEQLESLVGSLVDRIVRHEGLEQLEVDLVQALLLLQRRDPALQRRVVRFLRGESLTRHDRQLLCGIGPRDRADDSLRTIRQLALIMHELQLAALVIVVDQIEDVAASGASFVRLQQALDSMRAISDAIPSSIVVLSCLENLYTSAKPNLSRSLTDRLDRDEIRLISQRQPDEIEQMLTCRLEYLYNFFDVAWRDDDPLYPFTPAQLDAVKQLRTRDCLNRFREYHTTCITARAVVPTDLDRTGGERAGGNGPDPGERERTDRDNKRAGDSKRSDDTVMSALDKLWRESLDSVGELPEDDPEILALVADALRGAAVEHAHDLTVQPMRAGDTPGQLIEGTGVPRRLVAICNSPPQRGKFGAQLAGLRAAAAKAGATAVVLRSGEIKFQPKTKMAQHLGELIADHGVAIALAEAQLRVAVAARKMAEVQPDGYVAWRQARRPLGGIGFVRQLLNLDRDATPVRPPVLTTDARPSEPPLAEEPSHGNTLDTPADATVSPPAVGERGTTGSRDDAPRATAKQSPVPASAVRLGVTDSFRADPILLSLEDLKTHVAFLGSTGSGKTTAALSVMEQLLERGVSVVMVDRKGDLARYVSDAWWRDSRASPEVAERKLALRERIEVALFTPGNPNGRPLKLPLVPSFADAKPQEREQLASYASEGLGSMMGYGKSPAHRAKASVLKCAITLLGDQREISIDGLLDTVSRPDPQLLNEVGSLQRHFAGLTEDLDTLRIQRGSLLSGEGEPLDVAALLPPPGVGKARLTIINTSALTEVPVLQFWISRLLVELSRLGRKRPSATLQAAAFFDEADTYVPATSAPPTKAPMFDLLRRSRSTGIGVLLATQNPGDFDYMARDNINTWLLGKITQDRAIEKMKNVIGNYPDVGPRLASQRTGSFFVLTGTAKRELKADRSLMETVQSSESEVAELARATRPASLRR